MQRLSQLLPGVTAGCRLAEPAADPVPVEFRAFLHRHADLLHAVPGWRIRLLVPRHLAEAMATYQRTFHEEFARALGLPWSTN